MGNRTGQELNGTRRWALGHLAICHSQNLLCEAIVRSVPSMTGALLRLIVSLNSYVGHCHKDLSQSIPLSSVYFLHTWTKGPY